MRVSWLDVVAMSGESDRATIRQRQRYAQKRELILEEGSPASLDGS